MVLALMPAGIATADDHSDVCEDAPEFTFTDENQISATFRDYVNCMAAYGITIGYPDGSFRPGLSVNRQQMALFIARYVSQAEDGDIDIPNAPNSGYPDRNAATPEGRQAIDFLTQRGVVEGYPDGTYRPGNDVTRAQMASFIARAMEAVGADLPEGDDDTFDDVDAADTHSDNINALAEAGIVRGYGDGTYRPGNPVTRQQMSQFIVLGAAELDAQGIWDGEYVEDATPPPAPGTNQTFEVTPGDAAVNPADADHIYTVNTFDADEITIVLADPEHVTVEDGDVSFETDDDNGDHRADLGTSGTTLVSIETGDVTYTNTDTVEPVGGEVTFTITGPQGASTIPVIFVAVDDELVVDEDGFPVGDFGIGGQKLFSDINALIMDPEDDSNPYGTQHAQSATLAYGADEVPLAGEEIEFAVYRVAVSGTECAFTDLGDIPTGRLVTSGSATTDAGGTATFTYNSPSQPAPDAQGDVADTTHCIAASWEPAEDSEWDGQSASDVTTKRWTADEATPTSLTVEPEDEVNLVGTTHTITAEVEDQFGDAMAGERVRFTVTSGTTQVATATRTTNQSGVASFSYSSNTAREDNITVSVLDDDNDAVLTENVSKTWSAGVATVDGVSYASLTDALAAADAGDTITATGTFTESFDVALDDVTITGDNATLRAPSGIGGGDSIVTISGDGVTLQGFSTLDEVAGVFPTHVRVTGDDADIANNRLTRSFANAASAAVNAGNPLVYVDGDAATVRGNTLSGGPIGGDVRDGSVTLSNNSVDTVVDEGIWLITDNASFLTISGNSVTDHDLGGNADSAEAKLTARPAAVNGTPTATASAAATIVLNSNAGIDTVEVAGTVYPQS
jgi:hypothetical protein